MTVPRAATTLIAAQLRDAQSKAASLFHEIERRGLIRAGETEDAISAAIFELGATMFDVRAHWHRRLVRSGPNACLPFQALPPDRTVEPDDIVSLDLGPVFGELEADFGRTFVLGADAGKIRLRDDLARLFDECRAAYLQQPSMTGAQLYSRVVGAARARGWGFGGAYAGHLVGPFPLSHATRGAAKNRIQPDNHVAMDAPDEGGQPRHWILEIHLLAPSGEFGGFFEDGLNF